MPRLSTAILTLFLLASVQAYGQRFFRPLPTIDALVASNPADPHTNVLVRSGVGGFGTWFYWSTGDTTATNTSVFESAFPGASGRWRVVDIGQNQSTGGTGISNAGTNTFITVNNISDLRQVYGTNFTGIGAVLVRAYNDPDNITDQGGGIFDRSDNCNLPDDAGMVIKANDNTTCWIRRLRGEWAGVPCQFFGGTVSQPTIRAAEDYVNSRGAGAVYITPAGEWDVATSLGGFGRYDDVSFVATEGVIIVADSDFVFDLDGRKGVSLQGITITNSANPIRVRNSTNIVISGAELVNATVGIDIDDADNINVTLLFNNFPGTATPVSSTGNLGFTRIDSENNFRLAQLLTTVHMGSNAVFTVGTGTPEGIVTADPSSLFLRRDTGDIYRKASGTSSAGWVLLGVVGANPSTVIGLSAVNGTATTFMRSDAAPALSQSIAPTWTGAHIFRRNNAALGSLDFSNLDTSSGQHGFNLRTTLAGPGNAGAIASTLQTYQERSWDDAATSDARFELQVINDNTLRTIAIFRGDGTIELGPTSDSLATTDTNGFPWIRSMDGVPTGVLPSTSTASNHVALTYDDVGNTLYVWNAQDAAWHAIGAGGGSVAFSDLVWTNSAAGKITLVTETNSVILKGGVYAGSGFDYIGGYQEGNSLIGVQAVDLGDLDNTRFTVGVVDIGSGAQNIFESFGTLSARTTAIYVYDGVNNSELNLTQDPTQSIFKLASNSVDKVVLSTEGTGVFSGDVTVATEIYDATGWNGDFSVPTKDAVRDKIETLSAGTVKAQFSVTLGDGVNTITTGAKTWVRIPRNMTVTGWDITADQSSSIVLDVWYDSYANFPPTVADTIAGSEKPTLTTAVKNQDVALGTWTDVTLVEGDYAKFSVDSVTSATHVVVSFYGTAP